IYLGMYERETLGAWPSLVEPGDLALDIGANIGAHTLPLARLVGESGKVIAFEPTAFAYDKLCRNLHLNPEQARHVEAYQIMLLDTGDLHTKHLGALRATAGTSAATLDGFLARAGIGRVDIIKLDVDGFECSVLKGAAHTLRRHRPLIVMELAPYVFGATGGTLSDLIAILADAGYLLETLGSWKRLPMAESDLRARWIPDGASMTVIARPSGLPPPAPGRDSLLLI
ncbi:MAG: FkbM family methyltransferase, partial [Rhodospirillales bacterium]|nr:FkbM family methyltransferase [Rhodospirillales bacterium]